jgi:aconitase A
MFLTVTTHILFRYGLIRLAVHLGENVVVMRINFKDRARRWLQMAEKFAFRGTLKITRKDGKIENVSVRCRIDTPIEIDYYQHGGILPFVLRQLVAKA